MPESDELRAVLKALLAGPSDDPGDAIWVDERYDPAEPIDPPAVRHFLTPRSVVEGKARLALARPVPGGTCVVPDGHGALKGTPCICALPPVTDEEEFCSGRDDMSECIGTLTTPPDHGKQWFECVRCGGIGVIRVKPDPAEPARAARFSDARLHDIIRVAKRRQHPGYDDIIEMAEALLVPAGQREVIAAARAMKPDVVYSLPEGTTPTMGVLVSQRELRRLAEALAALPSEESSPAPTTEEYSCVTCGDVLATSEGVGTPFCKCVFSVVDKAPATGQESDRAR